ncbi:MAG: hypothetical protein MEP44_00970, partial [Blastomonas sp.]|nr:hypothetical protein [Blastomonas sp.]
PATISMANTGIKMDFIPLVIGDRGHHSSKLRQTPGSRAVVRRQAQENMCKTGQFCLGFMSRAAMTQR